MGSLEWNILSKITNLYVQVIFEPLLSNKRYVKNVQLPFNLYRSSELLFVNVSCGYQLPHYVGQHQPTIIKQGSSPVATSTTGLIIQKNLKNSCIWTPPSITCAWTMEQLQLETTKWMAVAAAPSTPTSSSTSLCQCLFLLGRQFSCPTVTSSVGVSYNSTFVASYIIYEPVIWRSSEEHTLHWRQRFKIPFNRRDKLKKLKKTMKLWNHSYSSDDSSKSNNSPRKKSLFSKLHFSFASFFFFFFLFFIQFPMWSPD